jgi:hypothetical protein
LHRQELARRFLLESGLATKTVFMRSQSIYLGGAILGLACLFLRLDSAAGQTVINVPPSPAPSVAFDGQIVNVLPGGFLSSGFIAAPGSQVNVSGGGVSRFLSSRSGSIVSISSGFVEEGWTVENNAIANIQGGLVDGVSAFEGARLNVTGGAIGAIVSSPTAQVRLHGFDFMLNGVPIAGLDAVGSTLAFNTPTGSVLSGVLADGTPFAIKDRRNDVDGQAFADGTLTLVRSDTVAATPGTIHLPGDSAPLGLRAGQTLIIDGPNARLAKNFTAGPGSMVELKDGVISQNFTAHGATVTVSGGRLDSPFRALDGSTINIQAGDAATVLGGFEAFTGAVVNVSGGRLSSAGIYGAEVNISGGEVSNFYAIDNALINVTGGTMGIRFGVSRGATLNISGGNFGWDFDAHESTVTISGGAFGDDFRILDGVRSELQGYDFRIDGVPVAALTQPGDSTTVRLNQGQVFTGIFADGTPFLFSAAEHDDIFDEDLILTQTAVVPSLPALLQVPTDKAPLGIRAGQTLELSADGVIADNFNAGRGSTVIINGGTVGENFEAIGATVEIQAGHIARDMDVFEGSTLVVNGGQIDSLQSYDGSLVELHGGVIGGSSTIGPGSNLRITGGELGEASVADGAEITMTGGLLKGLATWRSSKTVITGGETRGIGAGEDSTMSVSGGNHAGISITSGGSAEISGGRTHSFSVHSGSSAEIRGGNFGITSDIPGGSLTSRGTFSNNGGTIQIFGGTFGDEIVFNGGTVTLNGYDFEINGQPVGGLDSIGNTVTVNLQENALFTGTLADGSPFAFASETGRVYHVTGSTVRLVRSAVPSLPSEVTVAAGLGPNGAARGQHLILENDGRLDDNFVAGAGSTVEIRGGSVANNFEAERSTVTISGGEIGDGVTIFDGADVAVSGGTIGEALEIRAGGTLNLTGGQVARLGKATGGTLNMTGGSLGSSFTALAGSNVTIAGGTVGSEFTAASGSTVNVTGGEVGSSFQAASGSNVNISGGQLQHVQASSGSNLNITEGNINNVDIFNGAHATISGGTFGDDFTANSPNQATLVGLDFKLNGTAIAGLEIPGNEAIVTLAPNHLFTGTLSDGTPFAFHQSEGDSITSLKLVRSADLPPGPSMIQVPSDTAPAGARAGQQLTLLEGGALPRNFNAGQGSTVNIMGGTVGPNFEAVDATVNIHGGQVGADFDAFAGSHINIFGGTVGTNVDLYSGSAINMQGGSVARIDAMTNTLIHLDGGQIVNLQSSSGSHTDWTGGTISTLSINAGATLVVRGTDFKLNGVPIGGLANEGDVLQFNVPSSSILTATMSDGTPVVLANQINSPANNAQIANGALTLVRSADPGMPGPAFQEVTSTSAPFAIGAGQTLKLLSGGVLPAGFVAGPDSKLVIEGGATGGGLKAFGGKVVLTDGSLGGNFIGMSDLELLITGGAVGSGFNLLSGANAIIKGGSLPASFRVDAGAAVDIYGTSFLLNNQAIAGLDSIGDSLLLTSRGQLLQVVLNDGSLLQWQLTSPISPRQPFGFSSQATLRLHFVPEPSMGVHAVSIFGLLLILLRNGRTQAAIPKRRLGIA